MLMFNCVASAKLVLVLCAHGLWFIVPQLGVISLVRGSLGIESLGNGSLRAGPKGYVSQVPWDRVLSVPWDRTSGIPVRLNFVHFGQCQCVGISCSLFASLGVLH